MISLIQLFEYLDLKDVRQSKTYTCGPAIMQSILASYGIDSRENQLSKLMNTTKNGTNFSGFIKIAELFKIKYKYGVFTIKDIKTFIDSGFPIIMLVQAYSKNKVDYSKTYEHGHYVAPIYYDDTKIYFEDPSEFKITFMTFDELESRWHGIGEYDKEEDHTGIVFFKKISIERNHIIHMESNLI